MSDDDSSNYSGSYDGSSGEDGYWDWNTELIIACENGDLEEVKRLIASGENIHEEKPKEKWSAIDEAVCGGEVEIVKYLIAHGANVNHIYSGTPRTPLHIAISHTDLEMVRCLLFLGADPQLCNKLGQTALQSAKKYRNKFSVDSGKIVTLLEEWMQEENIKEPETN